MTASEMTVPATGSRTLSATAATPAARLSRPSPGGCQSGCLGRCLPGARGRRLRLPPWRRGRRAATGGSRSATSARGLAPATGTRPGRRAGQRAPAAGHARGSAAGTRRGSTAQSSVAAVAAVPRAGRGMPSWPASHRALGRDCGSVDSAAVTNGSSCGGIPATSGFPSSTRKKIVW